MVVCDFCGATPIGDDGEVTLTGDEVPLIWVVSVEAGVTRTYCASCSREHLRSIEAKLDSEWW
jgi:hypothetical protein